MDVMNVTDQADGGAHRLWCCASAGVAVLGGGTAGSGAAPSGMVGRVLAAAGKGGTPLLDLLEAWGTAAVIDGLVEAVSVEGGEVAVRPDGGRAALIRVDAAVRALGATAGSTLEIGIAVTSEGAATIVRVDAAPSDRLDRGLATRRGRLAPSKPAAVRAAPASAPVGTMVLAPGARLARPSACLA